MSASKVAACTLTSEVPRKHSGTGLLMCFTSVAHFNGVSTPVGLGLWVCTLVAERVRVRDCAGVCFLPQFVYKVRTRSPMVLATMSGELMFVNSFFFGHAFALATNDVC